MFNASDQASSEPGGKSARTRGLEELYVKYCVNPAGVKTSQALEAELTRHVHMVELRAAVLENKGEVMGGGGAGGAEGGGGGRHGHRVELRAAVVAAMMKG